jgi:hypothetical protein
VAAVVVLAGCGSRAGSTSTDAPTATTATSLGAGMSVVHYPGQTIPCVHKKDLVAMSVTTVKPVPNLCPPDGPSVTYVVPKQ